MARRVSIARMARVRFPHPRGDGPQQCAGGGGRRLISPPAWGWPGPTLFDRVWPWDFPTRVGMARFPTSDSLFASRFPHPRGDGPQRRSNCSPWTRISPPAWWARRGARNQAPMVCYAGPARPCGDGLGRGGAVRARSMGLRTVAENGPCPIRQRRRLGIAKAPPARQAGMARRAVGDAGRLDIAVAPHRPPTTSPRAAPTDAGRQAQYGCLVSGFQLHVHPGLVELHNALTSRTNLSSSRSHVWI